MKYLLIATALIMAIVAIKGETWNSNRKGLKKITWTGWITGLLAFVTASISMYIENVEQSIKYNKKVESVQKRFCIIEQLAYDFHQIELLAFEFEKHSNLFQVLLKVQLHTKFIKNSIEINSELLTQQELLSFERFIRLSNEEVTESKIGKNFMNDSPMSELARFARGMRYTLCEPILENSEYCNNLQSNRTANEFFIQEDLRMVEAISQAQKTLPEVLSKTSELKDYNLELQVKVAIPVGDGSREHMWLRNVKHTSGYIIGKIDNQPVEALYIDFGQTYTAEFSDVSDWVVVKNGMIYGGYMLRVSLSRMSNYELEYFYTHFKYIVPKDILLL